MVPDIKFRYPSTVTGEPDIPILIFRKAFYIGPYYSCFGE
jgi:hypothetical protein